MVNTNMVLERFHHTLKSTYLNRSENRRLDFVLRALLRCTADMVREVEVMVCLQILNCALSYLYNLLMFCNNMIA